MGGGDLNMKKSWHPTKRHNQEAVWIQEQRKAEEDKRIAEMMKEKEEERQVAELRRLQALRTGKKIVEKQDWMYAVPLKKDDGAADDYLLGKKRVDDLLKLDEDNNALKKDIATKSEPTTIINARDLKAKTAQDPLLAIKRQEQAQMEALRSRKLMEAKLHSRHERDREDHHRSDRHRHDRDGRNTHRDRHERESRRHERKDREDGYSRYDRYDREQERERERDRYSRTDKYAAYDRKSRYERSKSPPRQAIRY